MTKRKKKKMLIFLSLLGPITVAIVTPILITQQRRGAKKEYEWDKPLPESIYLKSDGTYTTNYQEAKDYVPESSGFNPDPITSFPSADEVDFIFIDGSKYIVESNDKWSSVLPSATIWLKKGFEHGQNAEYTTKIQEAKGYVPAIHGHDPSPISSLDPANAPFIIDGTIYSSTERKIWDKTLPMGDFYLANGSSHGNGAIYTSDKTKADGYVAPIPGFDPPAILVKATKDSSIEVDGVTYNALEAYRSWSIPLPDEDLWLKSGVNNTSGAVYTNTHSDAIGYVEEVKATMHGIEIGSGGEAYSASNFTYEEKIVFTSEVQPSWDGNVINGASIGANIDEALFSWKEIKSPIKGVALPVKTQQDKRNSSEIIYDNFDLNLVKERKFPSNFEISQYLTESETKQEKGEWVLQFDGHDTTTVVSAFVKPSPVTSMDQVTRDTYKIDQLIRDNFDKGQAQINGEWEVKYNNIVISELTFNTKKIDHDKVVTDGEAPTGFDLADYNAGSEEVIPDKVSIELSAFEVNDEITVNGTSRSVVVEYWYYNLPDNIYELGDGSYTADISKADGYILGVEEVIPSVFHPSTSDVYANNDQITIDEIVYTFMVKYLFDKPLPSIFYEDKNGNYTTTKEYAKDYIASKDAVPPSSEVKINNHQYKDGQNIKIDDASYIYIESREFRDDLPSLEDDYYYVSENNYSNDISMAEGYEVPTSENIPPIVSKKTLYNVAKEKENKTIKIDGAEFKLIKKEA